MSLISRSRRLHVVLDDDMRRLRATLALGERQGLDGAAQRGQRVLQLVRDVGGEALDRLDPVVERLRHVAQRAREMADLVRAVGEIGDLLRDLDARARTRSAASASRRTGPAMVPARKSDSMIITQRRDAGRPAGWRSAPRR